VKNYGVLLAVLVVFFLYLSHPCGFEIEFPIAEFEGKLMLSGASERDLALIVNEKAFIKKLYVMPGAFNEILNDGDEKEYDEKMVKVTGENIFYYLPGIKSGAAQRGFFIKRIHSIKEM